jgi:protein TonB
MFDDLVLSGTTRKGTNSRWTIVLSTLLQVTILGVMILIPLIYTEALPRAMLATMLVAPPPPPPPPPPPQVQQVVQVRHVARIINQGKMLAPTVIPKEVKMIKEEEMPPDTGFVGVAGGVPGGIPGGSAGGVLGGILGSGAPPPPKVTPKRISVGGQVQAARLISQPKPIYPPLAKQARISGTVRLHAVIAKDGTVQQLEMVSGHPLLVQSALDAVRQWRYQPTLLNGEPVEVETFIEVVFTLSS